MSNHEIVLKDLAIKYNIPYIENDLSEVSISEEALKKIDASMAQRYHILPLLIKDDSNTLQVITDNIAVFDIMDDLRFITKMNIEFILTEPQNVVNAINTCYSLGGLGEGADFVDIGQSLQMDTVVDGEEMQQVDKDEEERIRKEAADAPIIQMVNAIIADAVMKRASDIHIEPMERGMKIRFRIDGELYDTPFKVKEQAKLPIISRVKIMSDMNIAKKKEPQDGSFKMKLGGRTVDFRCSVIPTVVGEKAVLRILDKGHVLLSLDNLGFNEDVVKLYKRLIKRPNGIILVTGPTGSGKTTTLYATLNEYDSSKVNITTVEDPVEYQLPGISQMQVTQNLSFAGGLRAILRQDPDVIMVGEIRDPETAKTAISAAQTGHLVLSTLHTNDSIAAVNRLIELGVESYLVVSVLICAISQRLVKNNCPDCSRPYRPDLSFIKNEEDLALLKDANFMESTGCDKCQGTGYHGRTTIYEHLIMDDDTREMFTKGASITEIKRAIEKKGFSSMWQNGLQLVKEGKVKLEELVRVAYTE